LCNKKLLSVISAPFTCPIVEWQLPVLPNEAAHGAIPPAVTKTEYSINQPIDISKNNVEFSLVMK